jgi:membrane protein YdbS with pleckstrin-like domain
MQCPHCETDVPESAAFCPGCGRRLADSPDAPVQHTGQPLGKSPSAPANTAQQLQNRSAQIRAAGDVAEQELWRGSYSYKAMTGTLIAAGLLTLVGLFGLVWYRHVEAFRIADLVCMMLLWLAIAVSMLRRRLGIRYRLTNQRFFLEKGILRRITERIEVIDIDDLQFEQNLVERFFDVGSITLTSTDRSVPKFWLQGIEHVQEVSDLIDQARRAERNRRGLYIESS